MSLFIPEEILKTIPREKILQRIYSLERIFIDMSSYWEGTFLDGYILRHCVESYFCDLERVKQFHNIKFADSHKRAGFILKWIIKLRPIQTTPKIRPTKAVLLANEIYAIFVALNHLSINKEQISNGYYKNLLYTLHNRNLDGEILASMMYLLEKSVNQIIP